MFYKFFVMLTLKSTSDLKTRYNCFFMQSKLIADIDKVFLQIPVKSVLELNPNFIESFLMLE